MMRILLKVQLRQISSWSDLKRRSLRLFKERPPTSKTTRRIAIWDQNFTRWRLPHFHFADFAQLYCNPIAATNTSSDLHWSVTNSTEDHGQHWWSCVQTRPPVYIYRGPWYRPDWTRTEHKITRVLCPQIYRRRTFYKHGRQRITYRSAYQLQLALPLRIIPIVPVWLRICWMFHKQTTLYSVLRFCSFVAKQNKIKR